MAFKKPGCPPNSPPARPACPPNFVLNKQGCCLPTGTTTPFGGPASGLWPSGSTPSRPPAPSCQAPYFAACFQGCNAPGNCGWTIITPPDTVIFDGARVNLGSGEDENPDGLVTHALAGVPANTFTAQFLLQEIAAAPTANKLYSFTIFDSLGNGIIQVALRGDGTLTVTVGPSSYGGAWTPMSGATSTVHLTVDALGVPSLWIAGVSIPLAPTAPLAVTSTPNTIELGIENDDEDGMGAYDNVFVALGIFPPATVFCCS